MVALKQRWRSYDEKWKTVHFSNLHHKNAIHYGNGTLKALQMSKLLYVNMDPCTDQQALSFYQTQYNLMRKDDYK